MRRLLIALTLALTLALGMIGSAAASHTGDVISVDYQGGYALVTVDHFVAPAARAGYCSDLDGVLVFSRAFVENSGEHQGIHTWIVCAV